MPRQASQLQRGFVRGRQLAQNVLDLYVAARIHGTRQHAHLLPALVFWDFAAAFASASHEWLFLALWALGAPDGFINLVKGIYYLSHSFIAEGSALTFFCWTLSGVLQRCLLSGLLFAVVIDPLLRAFEALHLPGDV